VISTNAGGIPEVNKEGVTGFLSDVGDVDDMANNALKILRNDDTLEDFKKNAVLAAHEFDIQKVLPLYEKLYQQAYESSLNKTI